MMVTALKTTHSLRIQLTTVVSAVRHKQECCFYWYSTGTLLAFCWCFTGTLLVLYWFSTNRGLMDVDDCIVGKCSAIYMRIGLVLD